jgi:hypothetical protein
MAAGATSGRLTLSDPSVKELAQASCVHEKYYDALPKLRGEANWQEWSDALQHAALMAGTDTVLNGEAKHPISLEGKQCTTAEWNDNIKRTAVWRSRNGSLLKAMRGATDIDFSDLGALNAHDTYIGLRSRYLTSDNQRAFKYFSDDLAVCFDLDSSPKEIANILQHAFDQYNQLVGDNVEQRLPQNLLKMAFLNSLNSDYYDWRKSLLRERDVLALGQGSTLTFKGLVELAVIEHSQLFQDQAKRTSTPEPITPPPPQQQQAPKRDIAQVDEPAELELHRPCSLRHHQNASHTNQTCRTHNPRLRKKDWRPSIDDKKYLAEHPEIEASQLSQISQSNETAQSSSKKRCSLRHHKSAKHTDQTCTTQNPQLRKPNWKPSKQDQSYLAQHPEIERSQLSSGSPDRSDNNSESESDNASESGSESGTDDESESVSNTGSESDNESNSENAYEDGLVTSATDSDEEQSNRHEEFRRATTADGAWERFAAARLAEVQAQIDLVAMAIGGRQNLGEENLKNAPRLGDLTGKWLLYEKEHVSGTVDYYHIQLWKLISRRGMKLGPNPRKYQGRLSIGSHGHLKTFKIFTFRPCLRVTSRPITIRVERPGGKPYKAQITFWGEVERCLSLCHHLTSTDQIL